jgi:tryptophan synthase alpha chain
MTSYSLVYRPGVEEFVARAADSGVDGLIVPDLPLDEAGPLGDVLARRDLAHVLLVAPTTPPDRLRRILQHSTGFVYCVSVTGITGQRETMPKHLADYVRRVKKGAKVPVCVGFGISQPEHVAAVAKVADGVIVGSAVVHTIADHAADPPEAIARAVADLCDRLAAPLR